MRVEARRTAARLFEDLVGGHVPGRRPALRRYNLAEESLVVLDQAGEEPQVLDGAGGLGDDVDDVRHRRRLFVTCDDDPPRGDAALRRHRRPDLRRPRS